jgi:hypothetical protein
MMLSHARSHFFRLLADPCPLSAVLAAPYSHGDPAIATRERRIVNSFGKRKPVMAEKGRIARSAMYKTFLDKENGCIKVVLMPQARPMFRGTTVTDS